MRALLQLQLKSFYTVFMGFGIIIALFYTQGFINSDGLDRFAVFLTLVLFSMFLSSSVFLQHARNRQMILVMPFSRRTIICSSYVFTVGSFLVVSCCALFVQVWAGISHGYVWGFMVVFIYAFSISLALMAFHLWFYFTGDIGKMSTSESFLSFIIALCVVMLPMALLSFWSPYVILIGPIWSSWIIWFTYRSAARHFEQKELGI